MKLKRCKVEGGIACISRPYSFPFLLTDWASLFVYREHSVPYGGLFIFLVTCESLVRNLTPSWLTRLRLA